MREWISGIVDAQGWAEGLGNFYQAVFRFIFRPGWFRDLFGGRWLGHPLHPLLTDVPVGVMTLALLLDIAARSGYPEVLVAATWAIGFGVLAMVATELAGFADHVDLEGRVRRFATVHATLMTLSLVLYAVSLYWRLTGTAPPGGAFGTAIAGFALLAVGAYLGGDLVFSFGNMVDRHAWRGGGEEWAALDVTEIPEATPTRARAGGQSLLVVRRGDTIHALHDTCAHMGCALSKGKLLDGEIECPCHGSRFRLRDGIATRGPAVYSQPRYEVRRAEGKIEVRRV